MSMQLFVFVFLAIVCVAHIGRETGFYDSIRKKADTWRKSVYFPEDFMTFREFLLKFGRNERCGGDERGRLRARELHDLRRRAVDALLLRGAAERLRRPRGLRPGLRHAAHPRAPPAGPHLLRGSPFF